MSQISYVDGCYVPHAAGRVHIEDRGYQFADAVYDGIGYIDGFAVDAQGHYARLQQSLDELEIPLPVSIAALKMIVARVLARNHLRNGFLYLQISRGIASREHSSFGLKCAPVLVIMVKHQPLEKMRKIFRDGVRVSIIPDLRWGRCDIKTTGLLANCMAKTTAQSQGFDDAWLIDDAGLITEGSASNAWIVDENGTLRTRALSQRILRGITRSELLQELSDFSFAEEAFNTEEAYRAREAFITSASLAIRPVVMIDGHPIAGGKAGAITQALQRRFLERIASHLPDLLELR